MAQIYYLFFKPLPADHTIELEVIWQPLEANQPVEHEMGSSLGDEYSWESMQRRLLNRKEMVWIKQLH